MSSTMLFAQDVDSLKIDTEIQEVKVKRKRKIRPYEPLAPAKAAFYSAVLPGLGQAYTGKYWKMPIVYAALGTGIYFYVDNTDKYNTVRDIYKRRLAGFTDDEFANISDDQLIQLQRRFRREQELSLLVTVGIYILNIIDANVTAHLQQYNISDDLSFKPKVNMNDFNAKPSYGVSLNYSF
ncbi:DUF5683 domain-containing protein [Aquimarina intermedia]|uniref:DUF5683 domain-containing protein n=1 Tax=Aquimarina intermedia TaxID=350814 RepID=A0A5S5C0M7_9FLAO|nr:DUF5683 domain-containing protein [Aquimarina intermedia]TYP72844.1 hypothetical protein BD809_10694 [Aquimarina intermedia]